MAVVSRDVRRSHAQMFDVKEVEQQAEEYRDKEKEYMTRESRLRQELESMKASMFKLQQEKDAALARLPKFSAPQGQEWLTDDGQEAKPFDGDAMEETIIDNKLGNLIGPLNYDLESTKQKNTFNNLFDFGGEE